MSQVTCIRKILLVQKVRCPFNPSRGVYRATGPQDHDLFRNLSWGQYTVVIIFCCRTHIRVLLFHKIRELGIVAFRERLKNGVHAVLVGFYEPKLLPRSSNCNIQMLFAIC